MKKKTAGVILLTAMTFAMTITAQAGQWRQDKVGWWYESGNGSYYANGWQWIDGDGNGVAECYYFNQNGYSLTNQSTPDEYWVNEKGQWTVNGSVQTRNVKGSVQEPEKQPEETESQPDTLMLWDMDWVQAQSVKKETSARTNKEKEVWANILEFYGWNYDSYVEYFADGRYTSFKATVAPRESISWGKENIMVFMVMGSDDEVLYEKEIDYRTSAFDVRVDISGQDTISLYVVKSEGSRTPVIVKRARFE